MSRKRNAAAECVKNSRKTYRKPRLEFFGRVVDVVNSGGSFQEDSFNSLGQDPNSPSSSRERPSRPTRPGS